MILWEYKCPTHTAANIYSGRGTDRRGAIGRRGSGCEGAVIMFKRFETAYMTFLFWIAEQVASIEFTVGQDSDATCALWGADGVTRP